MTVKTGNKWGAGTDANVFINVSGSDGDTGELHLQDSLTNTVNKFEKNSEDIFKVGVLLICCSSCDLSRRWRIILM